MVMMSERSGRILFLGWRRLRCVTSEYQDGKRDGSTTNRNNLTIPFNEANSFEHFGTHWAHVHSWQCKAGKELDIYESILFSFCFCTDELTTLYINNFFMHTLSIFNS